MPICRPDAAAVRRRPTPTATSPTAHDPVDAPQESDAHDLDAPLVPSRTTACPTRACCSAARAQGQGSRRPSASAATLLAALSEHGVEARLIGTVSGPRVTRYELQLAPGTKVSRVTALRDDLAYALATTEIRILAPIPGKQAVGVEVPNRSPNLVSLGDLVDEPAVGSPLTVWLGKDISGQTVVADLARMPHLLIAGTTGSGKSGCINSMLCSILLRATPDEVRMILIDPKKVELNHYETIPHLLTPVVTNMKNASAVLANVVRQMEERYELMGHPQGAQPGRDEPRARARRQGAAALHAGRDRRAGRPDDGLAGRGRGRDHPPGAEVARGRHPPAAGHAAPVGRRHHRHDQGQRAEPHRLRRLLADRLARDPRHGGRRGAARLRRHALQAARHLAPAARAGRLHLRGGDRAARAAVPHAGRAGVQRGAAGGRARRGGRGARSRTRTTCSTTPSCASPSTRRPRSRSCSGACASATRARAAWSTCSSGAA